MPSPDSLQTCKEGGRHDARSANPKAGWLGMLRGGGLTPAMITANSLPAKILAAAMILAILAAITIPD